MLTKTEKAEMVLKGHCSECLHPNIGSHKLICLKNMFYPIYEINQDTFKKYYQCEFTPSPSTRTIKE